MEYEKTVLEQAIELYDRLDMEHKSQPKQRGGSRPGSGRKSAFGNTETAQYMLPKSCADACKEYARVMLSNNDIEPMPCRDGHAEIRMQLPKGSKALLAAAIEDWNAQGIQGVPAVIDGYSLPDYDNVILQFSDVCNLAELIWQCAYKAGMRDA